MDRNCYQITEYWHNWPYGTDSRIVARGATLKSCLDQYRKHLKTRELARVDRKAISAKLYCDGVRPDVALIEQDSEVGA
jgi:hypothetical protein